MTGLINWQNPINQNHHLAKGLQAWWLVTPHGQGGATLRDLQGRHHGTLTNMDPATDWVGPIGDCGYGAIEFNGVDEVLRKSGWTPPANLTIAATVRTTVSQTNNYFFGQYRSGAGHYLSLAQRTGNKALLVCNNDGVSFRSATGGPALNDGKPHRILGTVSASGNLELYVDGASVGSETGWTPTSDFDRLTAGALDRLSSPVVEWVGKLDSATAWNRVLSASEVRADFQEWKTGYPNLLNRSRIIVPATGGAITLNPAPITINASVVAPAISKRVNPSPIPAYVTPVTPVITKRANCPTIGITATVVTPTITKRISPQPLTAEIQIVSPSLQKHLAASPIAMELAIATPTVSGGASPTPSAVRTLPERHTTLTLPHRPTTLTLGDR